MIMDNMRNINELIMRLCMNEFDGKLKIIIIINNEITRTVNILSKI